MEIVVISIILIVGLLILYLLIKSEISKSDNTKVLTVLQKQMSDINRVVDERYTQSVNLLTGAETAKNELIGNIFEYLAKIEETNKQVITVTDQVRSVQDILKNPRQRGVLGEYFLEAILNNVLPPGGFRMQHKFKDGSLVDAAIYVKDKVIPVDSKFSLDNYVRLLESESDFERQKYEAAIRQDLKTRIDETSKYIKPGENTTDFAFMFIPAESLYYDLTVNKVGSIKESAVDLLEYALVQKRVILVSPTTFFAYLQTVLQGLKALQIEESAKEIKENVEELKKHLTNYEVLFKKIGTNMSTVINMYNNAYKEFVKIDKDITRITGSRIGVVPELVAKPLDED